MSIYQRYLSKSLIFFSGVCIIFLLFIESNIGFKCILNFTSRFFLGLQIEEVSGNWHDFRLKNIRYNTLGFSAQADTIHIRLDLKSLFKISTVCKEIEADNLIVLFKNHLSSHSLIKDRSSNIIKNNIFIKHSIVFQKIHINKILLQTKTRKIFLSNFFSGVELINNAITFSPTYIDTIHIMPLSPVVTSNITLKKKFKKNNFELMNSFFNTQKIKSFLYLLSTQSKFFLPLNINLTFLKCKNLNLLDNKINTFFSIELNTGVTNNILKIRRIKINSNFLRIQSYGKIIFNTHSMICNINNKILTPNFHNKIIDFSFKARLSNSFYIQLKSNNSLFLIKEKITLKKFNFVLKGRKNHYSLFFQNVLSIKGIPSIFINVNGFSNSKNIILKKIKFSFIRKCKFYKKKFFLKSFVKYHQSISQLIGNINLSGKSNNNVYSLCASKINLDSSIMKKKLSVLGSFCYKKFNVLEIPRIDVSSGKNKLYLKGVVGNKINIYSSIRANNLDYFLPHLQGKIESESNIYGSYELPVMKNKVLVRDLKWDDMYLKSMKIFSNTNINNTFLGKVLFDIKQLRFNKFLINSLNIKINWDKKKQNFYLLLKSPNLYVNIILNSIIDDHTGNWHGFFKKINVKNSLGELSIQKSPFFYYSNTNVNNISTKKINIKNTFSSFLYNTKKSIFDQLSQYHIDFNTELSIKAKLNWMLEKNFYNAEIFLKSQNIRLKKSTKEAIFYENIDDLKISLNLKNNDLKSRWIVKKYINSLEKNVSGYLNLLDIYNQKNIEGQLIISKFPISFINFFTTNFKQVQGLFDSKIKFFGTLYHPKVSADVNLNNVFIQSDNILQYIILFFPYFSGKTDHIKINQEIIIKKSHIIFTLNTFLKDQVPEWNLSFFSKKISVVIFPKIKINFSSQLDLHYLLEKYDLIGYIECFLFRFIIDEKNFIF